MDTHEGHLYYADRQGKSLNEAMGWGDLPMTHRQYLMWCVWYKRDFERPERADHYSMQIACEVRRVLSSKPQEIKMKDFLLTFNHTPPATTQGGNTPTSPRKDAGGSFQATTWQQSQAIWLGWAGLKKNKDGSVTAARERKPKLPQMPQVP